MIYNHCLVVGSCGGIATVPGASVPDDSFTLTTDARGLITRVDPAVQRVLGYSPAELVGRSFYHLAVPGTAGPSADIREAIGGQKPFACLAVSLAGKGGRVVEASISGLPAAVTGHDGGCHVIVHRMGPPGSGGGAGDILLQAPLFLELVCHDLNNMIQAETGYLELALESVRPDTEAYGYLKRSLAVKESSARLIANVQKLLRIGSGPQTLESIDLGRVLGEAVSLYEYIHDQAVEIDFAPVYGCYVMANELLKDVFLNIIGNAIQHHPTGSPAITIRVWELANGEEDGYMVTIEDDGPGIPDELKGRLFNRFEMGRTASGGTGLGLYLVKTLIEGFRGMAWVEDRVPGDYRQGSRFVIALPAAGATGQS